MKRRFTDQELYFLRNNIPVDAVVKDILKIPSQISNGIFRFACPLCNRFNTGINPDTNLARCFSCSQNFNPIDIVIAVRKLGFVEAATLLKRYSNNIVQKKQILKIPPENNNAMMKEPASIGNILSGFLDKSHNAPKSLPLETLANLERDVVRLFEQIAQLKNTIRTKE